MVIDRDVCVFEGEGLVRDPPYELLYYPALPLEGLGNPLLRMDKLPDVKRKLVDRVKASMQMEGMRNPLTVEWFGHNDIGNEPMWSIRIGNNRHAALLEMGCHNAPALVIVPLVEPRRYDEFQYAANPPSGDYVPVDFMSALALFDASHPWWHSPLLKLWRPDLVPPAA